MWLKTILGWLTPVPSFFSMVHPSLAASGRHHLLENVSTAVTFSRGARYLVFDSASIAVGELPMRNVAGVPVAIKKQLVPFVYGVAKNHVTLFGKKSSNLSPLSFGKN